ncbi:hypothetical protein TNCV_4011621 [Trichonephila clavipes]|nr:hypothetical protein TNCV_4011621 [Trichonephila clavipes]
MLHTYVMSYVNSNVPLLTTPVGSSQQCIRTGGEMNDAIIFSLTSLFHPENPSVFIRMERIIRIDLAFVLGKVKIGGGKVIVYAGISNGGHTDARIIQKVALTGQRYKDGFSDLF